MEWNIPLPPLNAHTNKQRTRTHIAHAGLVLIKAELHVQQEKLPNSQKLDASTMAQQFCQETHRCYFIFLNNTTYFKCYTINRFVTLSLQHKMAEAFKAQ